MIIGTKTDLEQFKEHKGENDKLAEVEKKLIWLTDDIWYVRAPTDGPFEAMILAKAKKIGKIPKLHWDGPESSSTVKPKRVRTRTNNNPTLPPFKKPPTLWGKVKSFWHATTGPRLNEVTRDARLDRCTKKGGYTWATTTGEVTNVTPTAITINGNTVQLMEDEKPTVKVGDSVIS